MKIKNLLFTLSTIFLILTSCTEKEGCLNGLAENFNEKANIDCCCEFNVADIIAQIEGVMNYKEECGSLGTYNKNLEISRVASSSNEILISGLGILEEQDITAVFKDGIFEFNQLNDFAGCNYRIAGKLIPTVEEIRIEVKRTGVASCRNELNSSCIFTTL